ncbi:MAG TPA: RNA methyltransferase [Acidobacteriaceae bacterium]|nr:RNA methyltransferase [Acidobacteriaceae bacterium]
MPELITSHQNARVKELRAAFANHTREARVAVEGEHLVAEALRGGVANALLFVRENSAHKLPTGIETLHLAKDVFDKAVVTETPQGIALLFDPPVPPVKKDPALILIAAGLQDPGNLGTLIRSAEAFGATQLITTAETVSPWNQKAIRASAGSIFRMPMLLTQTPRQIAALKQSGVKLFAAVAGDGVPFTASSYTSPSALLIGSEGAGLSPELLHLANEHISIPMPGKIESLNAAIAGSLLLYEASRQRTASK